MTKLTLIMAGGTGGHIFPGLAVAKILKKEGWQLSWLGALNGLESRLVPEAGIPLYTLPVAGLRGKSTLGWLLAPFKLAHAVYLAVKLLRQLKPAVVIGFGGYASGPGGLAAWLLGIPLIIHEQNAIAGLTNQWLARVAKLVLQAFPNTFSVNRSAQTVGNPIRQELIDLPAPVERMADRTGPLRLLILGGSRGAIALNKTIAEGLALIPADERPEVWQQTGDAHLAATKAAYATHNVVARLEPFIHNMPLAYQWADLVICRAGALTVSELAAVGVASILVPYPYAVDNHQLANAQFLERAQAAVVMTQADFTPARFLKLYHRLATHSALLAMAQAAYSQRRIDAVDIIKQHCVRLTAK